MSQIEFDFATVSDSGYDDDGFLEVGIDHCGDTEKVGGAKATACMPYGFDSRPLDPTEAGECEMLFLRESDRHSAMPTTDRRVVALLPKQRKGGSRQYCADGNYLMFEGADPATAAPKRAGSMVASVKYVAEDGSTKAHVLRMDKRTAGSEQISFLHGEGQGLVMTATGKKSALLRNAAGTAGFETNNGGNTISGKTKVVGSLTVGPAGAQGLVMAKPLIAILQQLITILAATGPAASGAPAAALAGQLAAIETKLITGI